MDFAQKGLHCQFQTASLEARTDGYLEDRRLGNVRALIEVKPALREKKPQKIRMQESAQMVAWILNDPQISGSSPGQYVSSFCSWLVNAAYRQINKKPYSFLSGPT